MSELLAPIIAAAVGAALAGGFATLRERRKHGQEAKLRHKAVYLDFLVAMRDAVAMRASAKELEDELDKLREESAETAHRLKGLRARQEELQERAAVLRTKVKALETEPEGPAVQRAASQLVAEGEEIKAKFEEGSSELDRLTPAEDLREQMTAMENKREELARKGGEQMRKGTAALDELLLVASKPMLTPIEELVDAASAYQDDPSQQTSDRFQDAEGAYLLALRSEIEGAA